jgi:hypothetical protein
MCVIIALRLQTVKWNEGLSSLMSVFSCQIINPDIGRATAKIRGLLKVLGLAYKPLTLGTFSSSMRDFHHWVSNGYKWV